MNSPPKKSGNEPPADFQSLIASQDYDVSAAATVEREAKRQVTDFQTLDAQMPVQRRRFLHRSATDYLIDILTPLLIFAMVYAIIFFLLDVRYIYSEVHDRNIRWVALCFVMGVVALNRLIARNGSEESILYIICLGLAIGFYTWSTTSLYDVGSVARGFLDSPGRAALFNMAIVALVWWVTNRLVHECCIDENESAGDIGILTGTARKIRAAIRSSEPKGKKQRKRQKPRVSADDLDSMIELEAVDPLDWKDPDELALSERIKPVEAPSKRPSARHPGISIFYFSIPVMVIFALGLPVLLRGGPGFVLRGYFYAGVFTLSALALLMFTSLGGLRAYFRSRRIEFPAEIGVFWVVLGAFMIACVMIGALQLPLPSSPAAVVGIEHETDVWARGSNFVLDEVVESAAAQVEQAELIRRIGQGVLAVFGLFLVFALLRGLGMLGAYVGRHRDWYPAFVVDLFNGLDGLLDRMLRVPRLPQRRRPTRISAALAKSTPFHNPMAGEGGEGTGPDVRGYIATSYDALCALAEDLGVPRSPDQTPYEFLRAFPKELKGLKKEASELTDLYVYAAYSPDAVDERVLDRLRKFWISYERIRGRYIR